MGTMNKPRASILVVDDTRDNLRFLADVLRREGYLVRPVTNGALALSSAQVEPPDLVLLDIMMPGMSGYEVCEKLKADERTCDVPVIFLSAMSEVLDKVKAFSVGGVDYITKPFQFKEVLARIETHLALRDLQRDLQDKNVQLQREVSERKRTEATLRRYAERMRLLLEIDQSILAARSPETVAVAAAGRIRRLIPCQRVLILALTSTGQVKTLALESGSDVALHVNVEIYQKIFTDPSLTAGHVMGIEDIESVPKRSEMQEELLSEGVRSYIIVPLFVQGEVVGALNLEASQSHSFTADHIAIATEVAVLLAVAIRQARLYELAQQEISERKQAEEALRQRTLELETRNAELDAFAHTVAHDLKTPLTSLIGYSNLLQKRYTKMSGEDLGQSLMAIEQNGRKMTSIIDELLLLASVRKEDVVIHALDMAAVVEEALGRFSTRCAEAHAEVVVPDQWPDVLGYAPWVEEVWANYISNALKYGGSPPYIELGYELMTQPDPVRDGPMVEARVRFWVRDNGEGLVEEERAQLFVEFTRLEKSRAMGHGLGLSIVRRIIERLGGTVGVESVFGEGSTFWFTLLQRSGQARQGE